jgi:putative flippase GtrA
MNDKFKALLSRPGYRYLIIGVSIYVLELAVIFTALGLGTSAVVAVGLSFWIGLGVSFLLQKFVTFGDKRLHHKVLLPQILAFSALVLFNFGFTLLVTKLVTPPVPAVVARTLALGTTSIWNFYLYKTRIFKTSENTIY